MDIFECAKEHNTTKMVMIKNEKNVIYQCPTCFRKINIEKNKNGLITGISEEISTNEINKKSVKNDEIKKINNYLKNNFKHVFEKFLNITPLNYIVFSIILGQILYSIHFILALFFTERNKLKTDFNWLTILFISFGLIGTVYITNDWVVFFNKYCKRVKNSFNVTLKKYSEHLQYMFNWKIYIPFSFFCTFMLVIILILFGNEYYNNYYINLYGFYFFGALGAFIAGNIAYTLFSGLYILYKISKDDLLIDIYSIDKCGGLKLFGKQSLKQSFFLILMLTIAGSIVLFNPMVKASNIILIIYISGTIFGVIISFFIPLYSIHSS